MKQFPLIALFVATFCSAIDHEVFKNCSRVPFCERLRYAVPDEDALFAMDFDNIGMEDSCRFKLERSTDDNKLDLFAGVYRVQFIRGPPFSLDVYDEDEVLLCALEGDRFFMENTEVSQSFAFKVNFAAEKLYGLFDHAWKLALGDAADIDPFRMKNSDSYGYEANSPMALYGAHPVIYGHSALYGTHGVFLHNAAEQWIDISYNATTPTAYFMVETGLLDLFVLLGRRPKDVARQIAELTGTAPLPQLWTLGYHQSRMSYTSQQDVLDVANLMVQNEIPMDAIWLDGDHIDDYKWFHWNHTTFTDPVGMLNTLSSLNKVAVSMSDPHIKVDGDYDVYEGARGKYFIRWNDGTDYQTNSSVGAFSLIDFLMPEAAEYYSSWYSYGKFNGSTPTLAGIWNDLNEPSIFNDTLEKTIPFETVHWLNNEGTKVVEHRSVHNIYGLMHVTATHKGLLERDEFTKRPFVLTRSTFVGSQRYAATWTGDNTASWEHFANSLTQCMTANLVGMVFCGADIGGFIGDPSDELLQRWYQGAVWTPFFRSHSSSTSQRREPYLFSEEVTGVIRKAIELRYKHIPYIYTLFYEHTITGSPIIAPLFFYYPEVHERDTQMLVGRDVMAVGVVNESVSTVEVLFPGRDEVWYRIDNSTEWTHFGEDVEDVEVDISTSPVFYRGGSIIPRKDTFRFSTFEAIDDPYTMYVNLDTNNEASGVFYYDDLVSLDYMRSESYLYWGLSYSPVTNSIEIHTISGKWEDVNISFRDVVVHSVEQSLETGAYKVVEKVYNTNRDGKPFKLERKESKVGCYVLYL